MFSKKLKLGKIFYQNWKHTGLLTSEDFAPFLRDFYETPPLDPTIYIKIMHVLPKNISTFTMHYMTLYTQLRALANATGQRRALPGRSLRPRRVHRPLRCGRAAAAAVRPRRRRSALRQRMQ